MQTREGEVKRNKKERTVPQEYNEVSIAVAIFAVRKITKRANAIGRIKRPPHQITKISIKKSQIIIHIIQLP